MTRRETDRVYDELLVTLVRAGDRKAAERLAARWHPRLMRYAIRVLRDPEQARDAVQDGWAGICKGWHRLSDPAKFPAWAYGIVHRKCTDRVRAAIKDRERTVSADHAPEPSSPSDAEDGAALNAALAMLGLEHRTAAILYFGEGLTLAEIAAATGVPLGTAKSRLFHARRQLKAILEGE